MDLFVSRGVRCFFVAGVDVTRYAETRIVGQHAIQSFRRFVSSIRNRYLAGVQRITDADTSFHQLGDQRAFTAAGWGCDDDQVSFHLLSISTGHTLLTVVFLPVIQRFVLARVSFQSRFLSAGRFP